MAPFSLFVFFFCFTISFHLLYTFATPSDTLLLNQTIKDGQTIVSAKQTFEHGFFSPRNTSENQYLAIWYKRLATGTVVWVANRENPIKNKSGELTLHPDGVLVLRDSTTDTIVWSTNTNGSPRNPVARLLDSGNLMVIENGDHNQQENYIWQSFDHPGDTFLPGIKFGRNLERGIVTNFTSWKSDDDPSRGPFMVYMNFNGLPQVYQNDGDVIQYRHGSWNGHAFTASPGVMPSSIYRLEYISNEREIYAKFDILTDSFLSRVTVTPSGNAGRFTWVNGSQEWLQFSSLNPDSCERYALCGVYASCNITQSTTPCGCLEGFEPS